MKTIKPGDKCLVTGNSGPILDHHCEIGEIIQVIQLGPVSAKCKRLGRRDQWVLLTDLKKLTS